MTQAVRYRFTSYDDKGAVTDISEYSEGFFSQKTDRARAAAFGKCLLRANISASGKVIFERVVNEVKS